MADQDKQRPKQRLQYERKAPGDGTPALLFFVGFMIGSAISMGGIIATSMITNGENRSSRLILSAIFLALLLPGMLGAIISLRSRRQLFPLFSGYLIAVAVDWMLMGVSFGFFAIFK